MEGCIFEKKKKKFTETFEIDFQFFPDIMEHRVRIAVEMTYRSVERNVEPVLRVRYSYYSSSLLKGHIQMMF